MQPDIRVRRVYDDPAPQDGARGAGGQAPPGQEDPAGNPQPGAGERDRAAVPAREPDEGGDPVCWAHLVCPECGAMISEGHRPGCPSAPAAPSA